ncbi:MAG: hypothetical protein VW450_00940 [Chloroflexota bacterium]
MRYLQLGLSDLHLSTVPLSTRGVERLLGSSVPPQDVAAMWRSAALERGMKAFGRPTCTV